MNTLKWEKQDPAVVPNLILSANTEVYNYWLQIYEYENYFIATIYGISAYGRFDMLGTGYCKSIDEAKAELITQWADFRERSRLYPKAKRRQ